MRGNRRAEPVLRKRPRCLLAGAPDAARRGLHQGQEESNGLGHRSYVLVWPPLPESISQLLDRHRRFTQQVTPCRNHLRDARRVKSLSAIRGGIDALMQGEHDGKEAKVIIHRDEMDRAAHERGAESGPVQHHPGKVVRLEAGETCPQSDVGIVGSLRLHADEMGNHLTRRHIGTLQQVLPREERSIQLSSRQHHVSAPGTLHNRLPLL